MIKHVTKHLTENGLRIKHYATHGDNLANKAYMFVLTDDEKYELAIWIREMHWFGMVDYLAPYLVRQFRYMVEENSE